MINIRSISKKYGNGVASTLALNNVSFEINDGESVAIVGASGSGKSTLLNCISTIDKVSMGNIEYNKKRIDNLSEKESAKLRLHDFGFVFQKYYLMSSLNVIDNIVFPILSDNRKVDTDELNRLVSILNIEDKLYSMPAHLSGGEQQRVAIARALLHKPDVIFADEPTGNLDSENGIRVIKLLIECAERRKQTVIYVTHDNALARLANKSICIKDGKITREG